MTKPDIRSREDIELLVNTFYTKVRKHPEISHFFNEMIEDWDAHLSKLTDFWQSALLNERSFSGNPMKTHIEVDQHFDNAIEQAHFGHWLELWFQTLDELFDGSVQLMAKERARNMAHMLYMRMFQARKQSSDSMGIQS
jgi:hemoglobin